MYLKKQSLKRGDLMGIIKKNKKGVSLAELLAAIVIIGIASTTITSMVITSHKGQLRAQQYVIANEIAKTYDAVLARDIKKASLDLKKKNATESLWPASSSKSYITIAGFDYSSTDAGGYDDGEILDVITGGTTTTHSSIYKYLYGESTDHFQLNGKAFDKANVKIQVYMISASFGYYKTRITVKYSTDREVTYDGTHFSDQA